MKKLRLLGTACAYTITLVCASANAAEAVVHNTGESGSLDSLLSQHSMAVGVNSAKRNNKDPLFSSLLDTVFIISC